MMSLISLLLCTQIHAIGLEIGTGQYLPGTGFGFQAGVFCDHGIDETLRMSSGISYWTKKYRNQEGLVERNCIFSDLSIHEDGLITATVFGRLTLGAGIGISVHLLKNYVKERTDYGYLIITNYYAKTLNRLGLRLQLLAEFRMKNVFLTIKGGYTALLMNSSERNLFYEAGNIRIFALTIGVGVGS